MTFGLGKKFGISQPVRRKEDQRLLMGGGRYADDINIEGQLFAAFLRSPFAHATIGEIDLAAALAAPGVVAIYTGRDLKADNVGWFETSADLTDRRGNPLFKTRRHALPSEKVRFAGEAVALVIAEKAWQARDAVELIAIDFEELPVVVDVEQALAPGAPVLHAEKGDNLCLHWENTGPEEYEAVARSAHKIVRIELINNRVAPVPMEPINCIASMDGADGRMTLYAPFQGGRHIQRHIADLLFNGDGDKVRHVADCTGGGFGARSKIYPETIAVAYAAKKLGRTVKWLGDRSECFVADLHGRDQVNEAELALDKDGKILGCKILNDLNIGAWVTENGARVAIEGGGRIVGGCYDVPVLYYSCRAVMTNTVPTDTYRGAGRPEANYVMERLLEKAAEALDIDSHELRRRNYMSRFPYTTGMGVRVDTGDFAACQAKALAMHPWDGFDARRAESEKRGVLRGIGLASFLEGSGGQPKEVMRLRFEADGMLSIFCGTYSHGQSHATVYAQAACEKLGVPFDAVRLIEGDTDTAPAGAVGTFSSRSSQMGTIAIWRAADVIIAKGKLIAGHLLQTPADDVTFEDGEFRTKAGSSVTITDVAKAAHGHARLPEGMKPGLDETYVYARAGGRGDMNYPNGCHICEVEVDPETGLVEIVGYTAVDDCGTVLNPMVVDGQIHGGVVQGIGQAMTENLVYDREAGQLLTGTFMDYGMPRAHQIPRIRTGFSPTPSTNNELGIKGVGEAGCCGAPSALVIAVLDALRPLGVEHLDMPLTPNRVWNVINQAKNP